MYKDYLENEIGIFKIVANEKAILEISYTEEKKESNSNDITKLAIKELTEYFNKQRTTFTFPIEFHATDFKEKVWRALLDIPYGELKTYGDIANIIGSSKAARAVGQAVHFNPIMIAIPCHRVVASGNKIGGFVCGIDVKLKLLEIEKKS